MRNLKEKKGGLTNYLNKDTQIEEGEAERIIYIDIDKIKPNEHNFYGLRDIDELAGLIAVSKMIEPLTVRQDDDDNYVLISGHRRRAAVEKLLEKGTYTERKLPCIVKEWNKIEIKQENGEIKEFDEKYVEMLNLIASNRGQREERTIEEKLQEIEYLEPFARAIYNQKEKGNRGNFRDFFAEEILNISKSQLQRINSMKKLTEKVKQAIDQKKITDTAAMALATMSSKDQDKCMEKITNGELKGTVQDIQKYKQSLADDTIQTPLTSSENRKKSINTEIIDIPTNFDDPQKEAQEWFYHKKLGSYQMIYEEAKRMAENETVELKAAQWRIRASVALYNIEELKLSQKNR